MGKLIKNKSRKIKSKRRKMKKSRKIRKYKMKGGGIEPEDIMFQDDLVCILKPEVKKGIIIWTQYQQPSGMDSLCTIGLKTAKQLHTENIQFDRAKSVQHPYIFFRAPYLSNIIDYTSIDSEINSSYGPGKSNIPNIFCQLPNNTSVSSKSVKTLLNQPSNYSGIQFYNPPISKINKLEVKWYTDDGDFVRILDHCFTVRIYYFQKRIDTTDFSYPIP